MGELPNRPGFVNVAMATEHLHLAGICPPTWEIEELDSGIQALAWLMFVLACS